MGKPLLGLIRTYSTIKRHGRRGTTTTTNAISRKKKKSKKEKEKTKYSFPSYHSQNSTYEKKHKTKTPSTIKHTKKPHTRCLKKDINEKINCTNDNIIA